MIDLNGKVAVVTGAASDIGLGFASARKLAKQGARVLITDVDADAIDARVAELKKLGFEAEGTGHDVTVEADWQKVLEQVRSSFGRLDILVNNAGIGEPAPLGDISLAAWEKQFNINMSGVFLGCQLAVEQFREQRSGGSIINISSIAGIIGFPCNSPYSASKGAVRLFSKALAVELGPEAIRVNSVHPGIIQTAILKKGEEYNKEAYDQMAASWQSRIPLGHVGEPEDIAATVAFLASDDARYVTGAEFIVDGGYTAS